MSGTVPSVYARVEARLAFGTRLWREELERARHPIPRERAQAPPAARDLNVADGCVGVDPRERRKGGRRLGLQRRIGWVVRSRARRQVPDPPDGGIHVRIPPQ